MILGYGETGDWWLSVTRNCPRVLVGIALNNAPIRSHCPEIEPLLPRSQSPARHGSSYLGRYILYGRRVPLDDTAPGILA